MILPDFEMIKNHPKLNYYQKNKQTLLYLKDGFCISSQRKMIFDLRLWIFFLCLNQFMLAHLDLLLDQKTSTAVVHWQKCLMIISNNDYQDTCIFPSGNDFFSLA